MPPLTSALVISTKRSRVSSFRPAHHPAPLYLQPFAPGYCHPSCLSLVTRRRNKPARVGTPPEIITNVRLLHSNDPVHAPCSLIEAESQMRDKRVDRRNDTRLLILELKISFIDLDRSDHFILLLLLLLLRTMSWILSSVPVLLYC